MPERRAILVVKEPFHAFGKDYGVNQRVTAADMKDWPRGTVELRLKNGFLVHDAEDIPEPLADGLIRDGSEIVGDNSEGDLALGKDGGVAAGGVEAGIKEGAKDIKEEERKTDARRKAASDAATDDETDNHPGTPADDEEEGAGPPDYEAMTKAELVDYAADEFGEKLTLSDTKDELIAQVKKLVKKNK